MRRILVVMFVMVALACRALAAEDVVFHKSPKVLQYKKLMALPGGRWNVELFRTWHEDVYVGGDRHITSSHNHRESLGSLAVTTKELRNLNALRKRLKAGK